MWANPIGVTILAVIALVVAIVALTGMLWALLSDGDSVIGGLTTLFVGFGIVVYDIINNT